jgi:hypothetical protein
MWLSLKVNTPPSAPLLDFGEFRIDCSALNSYSFFHGKHVRYVDDVEEVGVHRELFDQTGLLLHPEAADVEHPGDGREVRDVGEVGGDELVEVLEVGGRAVGAVFRIGMKFSNSVSLRRLARWARLAISTLCRARCSSTDSVTISCCRWCAMSSALPCFSQ